VASTRSRAIDFAIERQRHAGFVGRAELLTRLDQLVIADRADRWVVLTGGPGMGKSAVLAAWLARREAGGDVVPHHFIRRGWANWDDPEALVGSLVAQIEARVPEPREPEADEQLAPAVRLAASLLRVSERVLVPRGERLVLLIDGLDEYDPRPGSPPGGPLASFLPYALPPGVSAEVADSLRHEVDCVVGIDDAIADTAARSFAVAFYRALGHRRSIGNAVDQAAATLEAKHPGARPLCATVSAPIRSSCPPWSTAGLTPRRSHPTNRRSAGADPAPSRPPRSLRSFASS
jgi:hypothetical protein